MKTRYLISISIAVALALVSAIASAQSYDGGISATDITLTSGGGEARLQMTLNVTGQAATRMQSVAVVPTLAGNDREASFPYVLVNGRNKANIYERHSKFGYTEIMDNPPYLVLDMDGTQYDGHISFLASIRSEEWMTGAALSLKFVLLSPAGERQYYTAAISGTSVVQTQPAVTAPVEAPEPEPVVMEPIVIMPRPGTEPVRAPGPVKPATAPIVVVRRPDAEPLPVAVQRPDLAQKPAVIAPPEAGRDVLEGVAYLDFETASAVLKPDYGHNRQELDAIERTMSEVVSDPSHKITSITITGYASPEGPYVTNERLAFDRSWALAEYLEHTYGVPADYSAVSSVAEDWGTLAEMVSASTLPYKPAILEVINGTEHPDAKEFKLRRMMAGQIWRTMSSSMFPGLRRVEYRIEYQLGE